MSEKKVRENRSLLTYEMLYEQLKSCGIDKGHHVMVHTSLSSLGFVIGGEETVIRVLIDLVGDEGTIMMPSQTWKNLDPETGVHWLEPKEWWPMLREHWPAYDKRVTPAIGMGAVARMFCVWPGVERSEHPARSVAAFGKYAKYFTDNHDLENIFGEGSPIDKLYEKDGYILLVGVGYDKNTSIHLSETRADFSSKKYTVEHSAMMVNGKRVWIAYETQDVDDTDFVELGNAYDTDAEIPKYQVGDATVRYLRQKPFVDYCTQWFEANRN